MREHLCRTHPAPEARAVWTQMLHAQLDLTGGRCLKKVRHAEWVFPCSKKFTIMISERVDSGSNRS